MNEKQQQIQTMLDCREAIRSNLEKIEEILHQNYNDQYNIAHQHWVPQIITALYENTRWLPRGNYSMDYSIAHILDNDESQKGVIKFIK